MAAPVADNHNLTRHKVATGRSQTHRREVTDHNLMHRRVATGRSPATTSHIATLRTINLHLTGLLTTIRSHSIITGFSSNRNRVTIRSSSSQGNSKPQTGQRHSSNHCITTRSHKGRNQCHNSISSLCRSSVHNRCRNSSNALSLCSNALHLLHARKRPVKLRTKVVEEEDKTTITA